MHDNALDYLFASGLFDFCFAYGADSAPHTIFWARYQAMPASSIIYSIKFLNLITMLSFPWDRQPHLLLSKLSTGPEYELGGGLEDMRFSSLF